MDDIQLDACRDVILDSINEGVFTVDLNWQITSFNRAAERITGVKRQEAIGQTCKEVFRTSICEGDCALKKTLNTSKPSLETTVFIVDADGNQIPIKISAAVLRNKTGDIIGGVETFQDLRQIEELRKTLRAKHTVADIVGKSPPMLQLFDLLPRISDSDSTVLVEGASGTGKEIVARAIHNLSPRQKRRFVAVNCGALPDTLLESELFGYKRGAFTDAKKDKPGRFALAEGGTLFLDEIGDISPAMQVRLLRVLQERVYEPLGAVEPVRANVRIIAASNRNLQELVGKGEFRNDLFYRLHVVRVALPPLIERRGDIPLLAEHFVDKFNRLQGKSVAGFSPQVHAALMEHDFPGNVRELENIIEHAFVLCHSGVIGPEHLPPELRERVPHELVYGGGHTDLRSVERILIRECLRKYQGNRGLTAKELGIDTSTLYRKIKALDIDIPETDGRYKSEKVVAVQSNVAKSRSVAVPSERHSKRTQGEVFS